VKLFRPPQQKLYDGISAAACRGVTRILGVLPTGGGKTLVMQRLAKLYLDAGKKVCLYTNRRALLDQTDSSFKDADFDFGVRAAGEENQGWKDFQICSVQTEVTRLKRNKNWRLHEADLVLVDEAHVMKSAEIQNILWSHDGALIVGLTATPIGLGKIYQELVVGGTTSECRACGALVLAHTYAPDEPDLKEYRAKLAAGTDLSQPEVVKAIMRGNVFGRVYTNWKQLNPDAKPTILFAPGLGESIWFAEQFKAKGVKWAHIDGDDIWIDGEWYRSDTTVRGQLLEDSKNGRIVGISNRFVFREGIDAPWLQHGILATVFGSLQSYLQAGGRLLRAHDSLDSVTIQDHGGNWWRHGSLNADRTWRIGLTSGLLAEERAAEMRDHPERQPWRCPRCERAMAGGKCYGCGYQFEPARRSRAVVTSDGELIDVDDLPYEAKKTADPVSVEKLWQAIYWRAKKSARPLLFKQARGLFYREHGQWPPDNLPLMPKHPADWHRRVSDVPIRELIPKETR